MNTFLILPVILAFSVVSQGLLNKKVGAEQGLAFAVFLNAIVFLIVSGILFFISKNFSESVPAFLKLPTDSKNIFSIENAWYLIPGLCGFVLVLGIPWSLQNLGSAKTFIILIVSQIILSLLAEKFYFQNEVSLLKMAGALVALVGAVMVGLG